MAELEYGRVLLGDECVVREAYKRFADQGIDQDQLVGPDDGLNPMQTTLAGKAVVTGPGTFFGNAQRTLTFEPTSEKGWFFDRTDLPSALPIRVSVQNVWTSARNIVLRSGSQHNYMRMVEHIIALRLGLGLDNLMIRMDSGDPPLFDRSSLDLVEALTSSGIVDYGERAAYVTVREPVTVGGSNGSFLTLLPPPDGNKRLTVDCAVAFRSAIGKQRIRFALNRDTFRHGALARTNTTLVKMLYCKTIGMIFADIRNLGYTTGNILVAGVRHYFNTPKLMHEGKSLEAVWHRATLDLLAAVALIDKGRFAGHVVSYKAGHALDVQMMKELYREGLLVEC